MPTVAVLGTGRMGSAMARALARGGADLLLWNRTPDHAQSLVDELGGRVVRRPADAAAADVCLTMLADGPAVEAVWDGPDGLIAEAHPTTVLVDSSTVPPETLPRLAERVRAAGAGILDAPVSGSVGLAESGELTVMVGGDAADLERARPVLDLLARQVHHVGKLGSGHAMKLAVNAVIFSLNNGLAEALVLAERAGIDRERAYEVLATSAVAAPFVGYKRGAFLQPDTTPVAFSLDLAAKDLRLITDLARRLAVPMAQADANAALIAGAIGAVGPDRDFSAVAAHLRARAEEGRSD